MERFSYKGGCDNVNVCISRYLKEELAWAIDKQLWLITKIMLFKTVIPLRIRGGRFWQIPYCGILRANIAV